MPISRLEAAQQQLDCAIRLLFNEDNLPSAITLSRAAFRVLYDLYPVMKPSGKYRRGLDLVISKTIGWAEFNRMANQLKHADQDAKAMIDPHPVPAMTGIGLAILLYHQATDSYTIEMQAFETVMSMIDPLFAGPDDPTAEGYDDFKKAVELYKNATHAELMAFGRKTLQYLTEHKQVGEEGRKPRPK